MSLQTLGNVDFWAPLAMYEQLVTGETARTFYTARNALSFQVIGRLEPGVTLEHARQAMKTMAKRLEEQPRSELADATIWCAQADCCSPRLD